MKLNSIAAIKEQFSEQLAIYLIQHNVANHPEKLEEPRRSQLLFLQKLLAELGNDENDQQIAYGAFLTIIEQIKEVKGGGTLQQGLEICLALKDDKLTASQKAKASTFFRNYLTVLYKIDGTEISHDQANIFCVGEHSLTMDYLLSLNTLARKHVLLAQNEFVKGLTNPADASQLPSTVFKFRETLQSKLNTPSEIQRLIKQAIINEMGNHKGISEPSQLKKPLSDWICALKTYSSQISSADESVVSDKDKSVLLTGLILAVRALINQERGKDLIFGKSKSYKFHEGLSSVASKSILSDKSLDLRDMQSMFIGLRKYLLQDLKPKSEVTKDALASKAVDKDGSKNELPAAKPIAITNELRSLLNICNALEFDCCRYIAEPWTIPVKKEEDKAKESKSVFASLLSYSFIGGSKKPADEAKAAPKPAEVVQNATETTDRTEVQSGPK